MKVRRISFKTKLILSLEILLILANVFLGFFFWREIQGKVRDISRQKLMTIAATSAVLIDVEKHEAIRNENDENNPDYLAVQSVLQKIKEANPGVDDIYTLRTTDKENVWSFVVGAKNTADYDNDGITGDNEKRVGVGEEFDITDLPEMASGLYANSADKETSCDKWGCWLSGYAPLRNSLGQTVAVVGVDISAKDIITYETRAKEFFWLFFGSITILFPLGLYVFLRRLLNPVSEIVNGLENFSHDLSSRIDIRTGDEFELIANTFNMMAKELERSYLGLENRVREKTKALEEKVAEVEKVNKAKSEFVSFASHQLRTPLSSIGWYAEMLLDEDAGSLAEKQKKYLEKISRSNARMTELVRGLLNVSRLEMGTIIIENQPIEVSVLLTSVVEEFRQVIEAKHLEVAIQCDEKISNFSADPQLFRVIIQNLVSNAVKYTPKNGKISIEVFLRLRKKIKEIVFSIGDSGYGIPKAQQEKIFTKLFRADNVKEKEIDGTGLGLYIVKSIVENSGGSVSFTSKENVGTTFEVVFPKTGMANGK